MPPILIAVLALGAAAQPPPAPPNEVAPVDVTAPRPTPARTHAQVVADRWSPRIITCRRVFVQNIGIVQRACASNRAWELAAQRTRHELMQAQWHWLH